MGKHDPDRSHCGWETAADWRQIHHVQRAGVLSLFSGYCAGVRIRSYGEERERERGDREREERGQEEKAEAISSEKEWTRRERKEETGEQLASLGSGRLGVGRVCL